MKTKVFNKGQVVIPADVRKALGIKPGDSMEVSVDREHRSIELRKHKHRESKDLAGSLARYATGKQFPTDHEMRQALKQGLTHE